MINTIHSVAVWGALLVLLSMAVFPLLRTLGTSLRRQGLLFCLVASGFLVSMATKPGSGDQDSTGTNTVIFVLGQYGERTGGGELEQKIEKGSDAVAPEVGETDIGYEFVGWDRGFTNVQADITVRAKYDPIYCTVTFDPGTQGERVGGGALVQDVIKGRDATAPHIVGNDDGKGNGWNFVGWDKDFTDVRSDLTLHAIYESWETPDEPVVDPDEPVVPDEPVEPEPEYIVLPTMAPATDSAPDIAVANTYDGYACDEYGKLIAVIQVKTAKAKAGVAQVTATVTWADTGELTSFKGGEVGDDGIVSDMSARGVILSVKLGSLGMSGTLGEYAVDGMRKVALAKDKYAKNTASFFSWHWKGSYNIFWNDADGFNMLSVTLSSSSAKVAGTLSSGVKVSVSAPVVVGRNGHSCCVPVIVTKKAQLAMLVWLADSGAVVSGVSGAKFVTSTGLNSECTFRFDAAALAEAVVKGTTGAVGVFEDYLPYGMSVEQKKKKWVVDGGSKTGSLAVNKKTGEIDAAKSKIDGYNVSGLKLSFKEKTGEFKGSFKVYYEYVKGKTSSVKSITMDVSGYAFNGTGSGTISNKKIGSFKVTIK